MASRSAAVSPARAAAFAVLLRVFEDDAYADRALRRAASDLDERDRGLAQRLAYGAVQRVRTLDHAIELLGGRRIARLDPPVRAALRLGAYQLAFVDGVARYAAVNESVELVRRAGLERAVAFTNAVLRRLAEGIAPLLDSLPERTAAEAALKHSYPDWIAETWWSEWGSDEARALMLALNEPAPTVVRLVRGELDGITDPEIPGAVRVDRLDDKALSEGRIWPQSAASQLAGLAVRAEEGDRTLDLCAAPGGKASMLSGEVTASRTQRGPRARARREPAATRRDERARRGRRRSRTSGGASRLRPSPRGRTVLRSGCAEPATRPALARDAAPGAPARAVALSGCSRPPRWDDRLLRLHDHL